MTSTNKDYRSFALIVGAILVGIFGLLLPLLRSHPPQPWFIGIGLALALLGLLAPALLAPVYKIWMKVGHVLGTINTFILLHLIFFFFLTPLAMLLKLSRRKSPFTLKGEEKTYRTPSVVQDKERMKEIF